MGYWLGNGSGMCKENQMRRYHETAVCPYSLLSSTGGGGGIYLTGHRGVSAVSEHLQVKAKSANRVLTLDQMDFRTLKEQVVKLLRAAILSGKIRPGERLNESVLARDLGLSRIPVREALQQLQEQGLVVDLRRRGKFVVNLSEEEIQKINSLRLILEGEALRLCRAKISPEGLASLANLVDTMEHSREASELEASALDIEFHRTVWRHSGNEYLAKTLESLLIPLFAHRVLWRLKREMLGWASILPNHHRLLLEFVQGKVKKPAEQVMLEHLSYRYQQPERFSSLALSQDH
jgi:DNA-binding GntR family transcriptional regulator